MINQTLHQHLMAYRHLLLKGQFGLEKENLRVNHDGSLALTHHPAIFGDKGQNPYITTDFSESQVEMITPPLPSIAEALGFIETLHDVVSAHIGDELLWPQSLPPHLPDEKDIPIARYSAQDQEKQQYREALAEIYGTQRQLISGIHFNYSLPEELIDVLWQSGQFGSSRKEVRERIYMKMVRNFMRYRWLLIWLYGESPLAEDNFSVRSLKTGESQPMKCGVSLSLRTSPLGYRNKEEFTLDFSSMAAYRRCLDEIIQDGRLSSEKELYLPLRMKFLAKDDGAPSYLEIRILDLDPYSKSGVSAHALYFSHLLLLFSLLKDETQPFSSQEQQCANYKQDRAACYGRSDTSELTCCTNMTEEAQSLLEEIKQTLLPVGILDNVLYREEMDHNLYLANNANKRKGIQLYNDILKEGFVSFHLNLAKAYAQRTTEEGYRFWGLEDMEMSTQLLLKAALLKGVNFELIDRKENFVRLQQGTKVEHVMQATKTSLDNYASVLMMENKVVTKKVLDRAGIRTPQGREYDHKEDAFVDFAFFKRKAIVIKPKSTNFGLGISILKENNDSADYQTALDIAFEHDHTILIEEFVEGREFRFFVINDEVVGILHRVPANVTGDGLHTIAELIDKKNEDPLRGQGYRTPLEKIKKGREEALFLKQQGLTFESIPRNNETVYLRENSNISTGGDSLDFTDEIHVSYKQLAIEAARAMEVKITGLDMMIPSIDTPANDRNYAIIEMNFNPAIHIHCYPYKGKNRLLNEKIITALGF